MLVQSKRLSLAVLALAAMLVAAPTASAQIKYGPNRIYAINPNPQIAPGVSLQQYAYNTAVLGKAYSQIPPYLLGYNPYPLSVNYGPVYNPQVFRPAVYNPYSPQMYGSVVPQGVPYAGGYGGAGAGYGGGYSSGGVDPLTGMPSGGGYGAYSGNPYYWNPYSGGYNYGSAMELMAYGQVGMDMEKARILREQANQAKLDTRKKTVDTLAYLRANEYTFTKEQADIAKRMLERVQKTPSDAEIFNGRSLNILLADLIKFVNQPLKLPSITLDDDILKLVNICGAGSSGNVGLLRNDGRFTWPLGFDDKKVIGEKERKEIESQAQALYQQAANNGKLDPNTLQDLENALVGLKKSLNDQVTAMPVGNYLEAQRFLDDFNAAVLGLKKGDVVLNLDFQQKFNKKGGKSLQELVEYMGKNGLRFAPASPGDDRAYRALQTALSAQSLAIAALGKEPW